MFREFVDSLVLKVSNFVSKGFHPEMTDNKTLEREIIRWRNSPQRIMQIKGFLYYDNEHDILKRKRTIIGKDGNLQVVENLPNNRIIDNQYAKMVNQKANYLFGQPIALECENEQYTELLKKVFNKKFMKTLKNSGKAIYKGGIAWLYPYYNESNEFSFRLFPAYEIFPFWKDNEHTVLDFAVRLYQDITYNSTTPTIIEKVEVYNLDGIHKYILKNDSLIPDNDKHKNSNFQHVALNDESAAIGFNWSRIPLIPLKANEHETPLLKKIKSLQDGINAMLSDFENNMQEDARNTVLVVKNYDGTDLGELRRNLATYGAVKVRYDGDTKGGIDTLEVKVNADNYKSILEIFKKALIENAMGYDAKDDRLGGNANQMNIQSMYSDIDIDANDTETEYQAAFEEILWFVNAHFANTNQGNFENENVTIIFNRDILINESEAIENCQKSRGLLSDETIIGQHPWVDDPQIELERLEEQRKKEQEEALLQYDPFQQQAQAIEISKDKSVQGGGVVEK